MKYCNLIGSINHLYHYKLFILPSAARIHTLPIAVRCTVTAAQDMDHHSPVMVCMNVSTIVAI